MGISDYALVPCSNLVEINIFANFIGEYFHTLNMYPKSPFKPGSQHNVFNTVIDDTVLRYDKDQITRASDRCKFIKISAHIAKINEQLYNLKVSKKCSIDCHGTGSGEMKTVMEKLIVIKQTLRNKALIIMERYVNKEDDIPEEHRRSVYSSSDRQ